jgi:hypothetical protein
VRPVRNESGIEIAPLYTAEDVEASGGLAMLGAPANTRSRAASTR